MARSKRTVGQKFNLPFAFRVRCLMEDLGTTQDELAKAVDKTRQTVSQYVNGLSEPGYDTLVKIADYFGVSTDYLLGRTDTKSPDATMQAVIEYTGLSEANIGTLHYMKENAQAALVTEQNGQALTVDGCKPFLDCLNDLLDAVYYDKEALMDLYIRLKQETWNASGMGWWYLNDGVPLNGKFSSTAQAGNAYAEYACMKIARAIEDRLKKKYTITDAADVDRRLTGMRRGENGTHRED